ncbi:hypothetical protein L195_g036200 [Trifolium pratense]|uniref:Uncharacterized protein n=1 Tax=Trifolium pratense TaxID=57577 RepID=A0A2K3LNX0_TRIPR|nr:hypothetical protein L195_g036200 [Trifolium pratense]
MSRFGSESRYEVEFFSDAIDCYCSGKRVEENTKKENLDDLLSVCGVYRRVQFSL